MQSSVERPCPGEQVVFTCAVSSLVHQWEVPSLNISQTLVPSSQPQSDHPFEFVVTGMVPGTSITSTATVNVTANLNSILVLCEDGNMVLPNQNATINLRGEHATVDIIVKCTVVTTNFSDIVYSF